MDSNCHSCLFKGGNEEKKEEKKNVCLIYRFFFFMCVCFLLDHMQCIYSNLSTFLVKLNNIK